MDGWMDGCIGVDLS